MNDHDIESAALIDLCDDVQNRADQIATPRAGGGCTRVVAGCVVAGFWLYVLVSAFT